MQLRFFTFWQSHSQLLDVIRDNDLRNLLLERTNAMIDRMKVNSEPVEFAQDQVEYFIAQGLMTTVLRWHHYGFRSTPEQMADVFGNLLEATGASVSRLLL